MKSFWWFRVLPSPTVKKQKLSSDMHQTCRIFFLIYIILYYIILYYIILYHIISYYIISYYIILYYIILYILIEFGLVLWFFTTFCSSLLHHFIDFSYFVACVALFSKAASGRQRSPQGSQAPFLHGGGYWKLWWVLHLDWRWDLVNSLNLQLMQSMQYQSQFVNSASF